MELTLIFTEHIIDDFFFCFVFENEEGEKGQITVSGKEIEIIGEQEYRLLSIVGRNTNGSPISVEIFAPKEEGEINPTKVFNYIVKKLKEVLCPKCM